MRSSSTTDATAPIVDATTSAAASGAESDIELASAMSELARRLDAAPDLAALVADLTDAATAMVPRADHARVHLVGKPPRARGPSPVPDIVAAADGLEGDLRAGPLVVALRQRGGMVLADLSADQRWPAFATRACELGVRSMLCLSLWAGGRGLGVLSLYATEPYAFTGRDEVVAGLLAEHAAIALRTADQQERLTRAVGNRDVIGQAKGILMVCHELSADRAFDLLVRLSQHTNRKLLDVATQVVGERRRTRTNRRRT